MRLLITGAAGFVGHHLVEHTLINTDWDLVLLTRMSRAGDLNRLEEVRQRFPEAWADRVEIVYHDIMSPLD